MTYFAIFFFIMIYFVENKQDILWKITKRYDATKYNISQNTYSGILKVLKLSLRIYILAFHTVVWLYFDLMGCNTGIYLISLSIARKYRRGNT
jgi:hypothetical protein